MTNRFHELRNKLLTGSTAPSAILMQACDDKRISDKQYEQLRKMVRTMFDNKEAKQ